MKYNRLKTTLVVLAASSAAAAGFAGSASAQQRFAGDVYQEFKQESCTDPGTFPCTVAFSTLTKAPVKVLKASCTILTFEGGSPSKEITGATLGRLTENGKTFIAGQYLAPIQSEFAGTGQVVLNFLVDTLWVVPKNFRPAIQISQLNSPPIAASCSIAGEELNDKK